MSENITRNSLLHFNTQIYKDFRTSTTYYSYIILTPIDGETLVTPVFYLNGSEATAHMEIKWESEMIRVRLVTEYESFYIKPHIMKIIIRQDGLRNTENHIFNWEHTDEKSWIEFKRPKFDNPKFIKFLFGFIYDETRREINKTISYKMELSERLSRMYKDKTYADLKVRVGTVEFLAHKAILAAKSPVFAYMLNKSTQEESENVLIIDHVEPKVFEIFLKYLYLGQLDKISTRNFKLILHLIMLSIIYKVDDFKLAISKLVISSLTPENVQQWLISGIVLNLEYIKEVTKSCIKNCIHSGIPIRLEFDQEKLFQDIIPECSTITKYIVRNCSNY